MVKRPFAGCYHIHLKDNGELSKAVTVKTMECDWHWEMDFSRILMSII